MLLSCKLVRALRALIPMATAPQSPPAATPGAAQCQPLESRRFLSHAATAATPTAELPRPDHVVIVVEENKSYEQILGQQGGQSFAEPPVIPYGDPVAFLTADPYLRWLARHSANLTNMHAETHPSQPNYIALFSGSTQGVTSDGTPRVPITAPSLGGSLEAAGLSFAGYSEDLPHAGFTGSTSGDYARKHAPWVNFTDVPAEDNRPLTHFPRDFSQLPTVSFVIPNQQNDMHSGPVRTADQWLRQHMRRYLRWAKRNNSLLVVTWDEGQDQGDNRIPTLIAGAGVKHGEVATPATHYNLLRTIEDLYGLPKLGQSADAAPLTGVLQG
jgi:hypothetical protein